MKTQTAQQRLLRLEILAAQNRSELFQIKEKRKKARRNVLDDETFYPSRDAWERYLTAQRDIVPLRWYAHFSRAQNATAEECFYSILAACRDWRMKSDGSKFHFEPRACQNLAKMFGIPVEPPSWAADIPPLPDMATCLLDHYYSRRQPKSRRMEMSEEASSGSGGLEAAALQEQISQLQEEATQMHQALTKEQETSAKLEEKAAQINARWQDALIQLKSKSEEQLQRKAIHAFQVLTYKAHLDKATKYNETATGLAMTFATPELELRAEVEQLRVQNTRLSEQLVAAASANTGTTNSPDVEDLQKKELQKEVRRLEAAVSNAGEQMAQLRKEYAGLQSENKQRDAELTKLRAQLKDAMKKTESPAGGSGSAEGDQPPTQSPASETSGTLTPEMEQAIKKLLESYPDPRNARKDPFGFATDAKALGLVPPATTIKSGITISEAAKIFHPAAWQKLMAVYASMKPAQ